MCRSRPREDTLVGIVYCSLKACALPGCGTWNVPTTNKGSGRAPRRARTAAWKALCTAATFRVGAVACSCCGPFGTTIGPLGFARLTRESPAVQSPQAPNRLAVPTSGLPWRSRSADLDRLADSSPRARSAGYGAYLRSRRNTGRTLDSRLLPHRNARNDRRLFAAAFSVRKRA